MTNPMFLSFVKWTTIATLVLNVFLLAHAWYFNKRAEEWVNSISGQYIEGSWSDKGFLVQWNSQEFPPACDVTVHSVFTNNGYAIVDEGGALGADDFHSIHLSKNGKITLEPVGKTAHEFVSGIPGTWLYKLEFTFHCSTVGKSNYLFWLNLDETYTTKAVVIEVLDETH